MATETLRPNAAGDETNLPDVLVLAKHTGIKWMKQSQMMILHM